MALEKRVARSTASLLAVLLAFHLVCTILYTVDIPLEDDWDLFTNGLNRSLDVSWLVRPQNEHRMVPTRLIVWGLYVIGGWNVSANHLVNFVLLFLIVGLACRLSWNVTRGGTEWLACAAPCSLLPAAAATNVLWAIQSAFHSVALFTMLAIVLLFRERHSWGSCLCGALCLVAATYSLAAGVVAASVVATVFAACELDRGARSAPTRTAARIAIVAGIQLCGVWWYFRDHSVGGGPVPRVDPGQELFWRYLGELVAVGYGREAIDFGWTMVLGWFTLAPLVAWMVLSRCRMEPAEWAVIAWWCASAAILATITYGRAGMGVLEWARSPRYVELATLMVPATLALWHLSTRDLGIRARTAFWIATLGLLASSSSASWNIPARYRQIHAALDRGATCVAERAAVPGDPVNCPTIYAAPLRNHLDVADRLGLSFVSTRRPRGLPR